MSLSTSCKPKYKQRARTLWEVEYNIGRDDVDVSKHKSKSNESYVLGMGVSVGTGTGGGGGSAATVWKKQQSMSAGGKNIYSRTM